MSATTRIVREGDTLQGFALYLGGFEWWPNIWLYNREKIIDPDLIFPGQEIVIPEIDDEARLKRDYTTATDLLDKPEYLEKIESYRRSLGYEKVPIGYGGFVWRLGR